MLTVNGRTYRPPAVPTVVVCVDGCEPDYLAQAVAGGHMPWLKRTLAQGTGLVADDEIATTGPLNRFVAGSTAASATHWHKDIGQIVLIALVLLHVAAIVFYRVKKGKNLVRPMLTGDKQLPPGTPAATDTTAVRLLALGLALGCAGLVSWIVKLGG